MPTLLMVVLLAAVGGFEWVRSMILIGARKRIEKNLRRRVSDATFKRALLSGGMVSNAQPISDLTGLRQFLTGNGLFAFFDAPWFPIYVAVMFMFHTWFGVAAIIAGVIMVILAYTNELVTSDKMKDANAQSNQVSAELNSSLRNAEVIAATADGLQARGRVDGCVQRHVQALFLEVPLLLSDKQAQVVRVGIPVKRQLHVDGVAFRVPVVAPAGRGGQRHQSHEHE